MLPDRHTTTTADGLRIAVRRDGQVVHVVELSQEARQAKRRR